MNSINIKPPIKYTDMAIYIDTHIYTDDCDDEKVFLYLYHLALMLSYKKKLFKRREYYEDFALSYAEDLFVRLKNPKQYADDLGECSKLWKITSILNYMKVSIYGRKVAFEQEKYSQSFSINQKLDTDIITSQYSIINQINKNLVDFNNIELECCLEKICDTIKDFLKESPYYSNKKEWNNIYISCLLTLLNFFVLSKSDEDAVEVINSDGYHTDNHKLKNINNIKNKKENTEVILYHLDDSMRDYVSVLFKKIQKYLHDTFNIKSYSTSIIDEKNLINITLAELENNNDYLEMYE